MGKRNGFRRAGVLLAGIAVLAISFSAEAAEKKDKRVDDPHRRKDGKSCIVCHVSTPAEGASRKEAPVKFGGDVVALCSSCHSGYRHMHPVKIAVAPEMKSPDELPLDRNGKITCVTCHDVMEKMDVHRRRKFTGRQLCLNCHVDSDILAQVVWYPTHLARGETGRLEIKVVDFRILARKRAIGESVLLYYYAKDVDTGDITFGTNVLSDDGSNGDRVPRDSIYTLLEKASNDEKKRRVVYTGWVVDAEGRRSNTVTLAVEFR